ncbi:MAG: hypothetical protein SPG13_06975 [Peptostreptococcus porci]|uniref:hypothetical protein n=1 Tax=Peptostreptococcus porci TaxID=2652282 RepID=UPI002A75F741|nr:hypothetical protein [Peptostreptococcus porci]MDY2793973.1 hypothetical protein [Peptostreptococcus porci]MDY5480189.1 hypothetical protein [Peptostreptococcus porci]
MEKLLIKYSYMLTSLKRSFLNVYDLSGGRRNYSLTSMIGRSDKDLIKEDWKYVGQDIKGAIEEYSKYGR